MGIDNALHMTDGSPPVISSLAEARKQTLLNPVPGRNLASPAKFPRKGYKTPKKQLQLGTVDLKEIMKVRIRDEGGQVHDFNE